MQKSRVCVGVCGQGDGKRRIEVIVKMQKKKVEGVRVDVNEELKLL